MAPRTPFGRFRVQNNGGLQPIVRHLHEVFYDGRIVDRDSDYGPAVSNTTSMSDIVTPGYNSILARGGIVNNPASRDEYSHASTNCTYTDTYYTRPYGELNSVVTHSNVCPGRQVQWRFVQPQGSFLEAPDLSGVAINAAFADAYAGAAQALVELAELHKTLGLLQQSLKTGVSLLRNTRRVLNPRQLRRALSNGTKVKDAKRFLNNTSSMWLQYRYGWSPLMHSIRDYSKALHEHMVKPIRVSGRSKQEYAKSQTTRSTSYWDPLGTPPGASDHYVLTTTINGAYKAYCLCEGRLKTLNENLGLTLRDVPAATWELIPYSFVVDWFLHIGDYIQAHLPVPGISVAASGLKHEKDITQLYTFRADSYFARTGSDSTLRSYYRTSGESTYTKKHKSYTRIVGVTPTLLPPLDLNFSSLTHLIDALALGYQAFGKR